MMQTPLAAIRRRRRPLVVALLTWLLISVATAQAQVGAGTFENIAPGGGVVGDRVDQVPADYYSLDHFVDTKNENTALPDTPKFSAIPAQIAHTIAALIWEFNRFLAMAVISLVTWAFGFNLITGGPGEEGAIVPIAEAITNMREEIVGNSWMVAAIVLAGVWAIGNALVRQRYSETMGRLGFSVALVVVAFALVAQDQWAVRTVSDGTTEVSASMLGIAAEGDPARGDDAQRSVSNDLFEALVVRPYTVLEFGGLEHCTNSDAKGVPCDDAGVARRIDHLPRGYRDTAPTSSTRGQGQYLRYFLDEPSGDDRKDEYDALREGDADEDLKDNKDAGWVIDDHDKPATELMGEGGAFERVGMAGFILLVELGAMVLVGLLALGVVVAQAIALLLLAFSPFFLLAALVPGAGHRIFVGWLKKLATALVGGVLIAITLAVLLAVSSALSDATDSLGFLLAFALQGAFFWLVLLNRNRLLAVAAGYDHRYPVPRGRGATARTARDAGRRIVTAPLTAGRRMADRGREQAPAGRSQDAAIGGRAAAGTGGRRGGKSDLRHRAHQALEQRRQGERGRYQAEERRRAEVRALTDTPAAQRTPAQQQRLAQLQRNAPPPSEHDLRGHRLEEMDVRERAGMPPFSEREYQAEERALTRTEPDRPPVPGRPGEPASPAGAGGNGGTPPADNGGRSREIRVSREELEQDRRFKEEQSRKAPPPPRRWRRRPGGRNP